MSQPPPVKELEHWYAAGLRFKCTGCGDCCTGAPGYVWVNRQEIEALANRLGLSVAAFEEKFVRQVGMRRSLKERKNCDCVFLDPETRRCTVYSDRPRQCRTWPFWDSNLRSPDAWQAACDACPGCGQGRLYSISLIEEQSAVIHI